MSGSTPPGLDRHNPAWLVRLPEDSARYAEARYEEKLTRVEVEVRVRFEQANRDDKGLLHTEHLECSLNRLAEIAARGSELEKTMSFAKKVDWDSPQHVEKFESLEASYFGRETPSGNKQVVTVITPKDDEKRAKDERFTCDLGRLKTFVEEGQKFKEAIHEETKYVAVTFHSHADKGEALVKVVPGQFDKFSDVDLSAYDKGGVFALPVPVRNPKEGHILRVDENITNELKNHVDYVRYDQERAGPNYVVAVWAVKYHQPFAERDVAWVGLPAEANGKGQDFKAVTPGRAEGDDMRGERPFYVLIQRATAEESRFPNRGKVVEVFFEKEAAVAMLKKLEEAVVTQQKAQQEQQKEQQKALQEQTKALQEHGMPMGYRPKL